MSNSQYYSMIALTGSSQTNSIIIIFIMPHLQPRIAKTVLE